MQKLKGKVLLSSGGQFDVYGTENGILYKNCMARGIFRKDTMKILAGDNVILEETDGTYVITEIKTRKNALIRPPVANLDLLFIIIASASPAPSRFYADKLTVIAEYHHIRPVIIISKNELSPETADSLRDVYTQCGYDTFSVSAYQKNGTQPLENYIKESCCGKTAAFCGVSGAGKSTLINFLYPDIQCETGELSAKIERGKNTTRVTRLYLLPGNTYLADTPGFSMLDIERFGCMEKEEMAALFPEFRPYLGTCRFTKCTHTKEDGCAVLDAARSGIIPASRHDSYVELYTMLKARKKYGNAKNTGAEETHSGGRPAKSKY